MEIELISSYHGFDSYEKELICRLLNKNGYTARDIKNRLQMALPIKEDWILQQFVAGLIRKEDRNLAKWRFLRETGSFAEVRAVLEEYVLDLETDQKLFAIIQREQEKDSC